MTEYGRPSRNQRQKAVYQWASETFGAHNAIPFERALRLFEEATELVQAEGVSEQLLFDIISHVYGKPLGDAKLEAGGVGVTLLAYCESKGISADDAEHKEAYEVLTRDPEYFRARHNLKADARIALRCPEGRETK